MSYEAGSKECRHLIEAKESLLSAMDALLELLSDKRVKKIKSQFWDFLVWTIYK